MSDCIDSAGLVLNDSAIPTWLAVWLEVDIAVHCRQCLLPHSRSTERPVRRRYMSLCVYVQMFVSGCFFKYNCFHTIYMYVMSDNRLLDV